MKTLAARLIPIIDLKVRSRTSYPRALEDAKTLATSKEDNGCYENSNATDRDYSKSGTK